MDRFIKMTLLLALGIFLYSRIMSGTILFYINERFVTLSLLASVGFILIGFSYYRRSERPSSLYNLGRQPLTWLGLLIAAIPVVIGVMVEPQPLGAAAVGNRELDVGGLSTNESRLRSITAPTGGDERMGLLPGERNVVDWLMEFQRVSDPSALAGEEARVIGFVYYDDRFEANTFMVARFVLSCCVADASPVGLIVQWPDTPALANDTWVEVSGQFIVGEFDGRTIPILAADEVEPTDAPAQPYLYR
jgi:putative membrane protein